MGLYEILGAGAGVVLIDLVIRVVALIIIPRDRLPTAAMAWLLAVFFIPVIGVLLFLLIGNPKLPRDDAASSRRWTRSSPASPRP
jgi:cardiolipin synthase